MGLAGVLLGRWRGEQQRLTWLQLCCPCTHSLVMHWFLLGPSISSETVPSWTKTGLYRWAHYANNSPQLLHATAGV